MPVDTEEEIKEEENAEEREARIEKEAEAEFKRNAREAARLEVEEKRATAAQRQGEEAAAKEKEDEMIRTIEEAKKEDAERTNYNKSIKGRLANRFGKGKYQKKPSDEEGGEKKSKKSGSLMDPTRLPSGSGEKAKTDGMTYAVIIIAALIWLIDKSDFTGVPYLSFLGGQYTGFKFDFFGVMRTNLAAVGTTTLVLALLIVQMLKGVFDRNIANLTVSLGFILMILQSWKNYWYELPVLYGNLIFVFIMLLVAYAVYKRPDVLGDFGSYLFMTIFFSFFWLNWGWWDNWKAKIHVFYIVFFGFVYLEYKLHDNPFAWHMLTPALIFVDFYLYDLSQAYDLFKHIPVLILAVTLICWYVNPKTWFPRIAFSLILLLATAVMVGAQPPDTASTVSFRTPETAAASLKETVSKIWQGVVGGTESRIDYATGGLYRSQVEKNQFEPLGVNLDRVRAAQPRFYTDEKAVVWGTIRSRTLSDPVIVKFNCYRWKQDKRYSLDRNDKDEKIIPEFPFVVYTLEEKDMECTFGPKKFEAGSNTVTLSATHNFVTSADKKVYFIDNERLRAMTKENLNPLKEYGKTEEKPKTIFTNGPVDIDIVIQNLVPVLEKPDIKPLLGIKLENRDKITDKQNRVIGQWQGKIKEIKELAIVLPDSIELEKDCLPVEFKDYSIDDCRSTCQNVCQKSCDDFVDKDDPRKQKNIDTCTAQCPADIANKCNEDCEALFRSNSKGVTYKGYQIDITKLNTRDEYKDIDRYKDFACRINPKPTILDSPLTTRVIRVNIRYNYELAKSFAIQIAAIPKLPSEEALIPDIYNRVAEIALKGAYLNPSNLVEVKYSPFIFDKAKANGFDFLLIKALIQKENPKWDEKDVHEDTNKQLVYGLMQVTEGTGKGICDAKFPNWRKEPEANIQCGIEVLKSKCDLFKPYCLAPKPQCQRNEDCRHPFIKDERGDPYCLEGQKRLCKSECKENICFYEFTGGLDSKTYGSKWYSGETAALRAYNGWGAGNEGYVDDPKDSVMAYYKNLRAKVGQ